MRRTLSVYLLALVAGVSALSAAPASADRQRNPLADSPVAAERALDRAMSLFDDDEGAAPPADPSMALRDLFLARGSLTGEDRVAADQILARPTDGSQDPYGDGYTVRAKAKCSKHVCIHWVPSTNDKPTSYRWVLTTLRTMEKVWAFEIGRLGYRRPVTDGNHGGNKKFDVYLKNVGSKGYYGYCAAEYYASYDHDLASGYCVLDNNFSFAEFGAKPMDSMRVTAAHEFFHAIQYAYQLTEDRWLYESTATWMEERFADDVNDNRQYLRGGQLRQPGVPLDKYGSSGYWQYGNWIWFEYLSTRFGRGVVREIWNRAGDFAGAPNKTSMGAVSATIGSHKQLFRTVYAGFAASNTVPGRSYPEGASYQPTPMRASYTLGYSGRSTGSRWAKMQHLTSRSIALKPASTLKDRRWRLQISVNLPPAYAGSAAMVIVHENGGDLKRQILKVNGTGWGRVKTLFAATQVQKVTVTLVNSSTRYDCWESTGWTCRGKPLDDGRSSMVSATIKK